MRKTKTSGCPFFESTNSRPDSNLEAINAEMGEANSLHLKVIDEKYCCFIRAESLRYIYMVKKETLEKLDLSEKDFEQMGNYNQLDFLFSTQLKKNTSLRMILDETYGRIVSMKNVPIGKERPELYRMFENGQLWEERYIEPIIREGISRDKKLKVHKNNSTSFLFYLNYCVDHDIIGCGVSSSGIQNYISGSNEHAQRKIIIEYHLKCNNGQAWKIRKFRHSTANFVLYKA